MLCKRFAGLPVEPLNRAQVSEITSSEGAVGWRVGLAEDHSGQRRELCFVLPASFPVARPLVAVRPSAYHVWPHCGPDGDLCLWRSGEAPQGDDPAGHMQQVLEQVGRILGLLFPQPNATAVREHFEREWQHYWQPPVEKVRLARCHGYLLSDAPGTVETQAFCSERGSSQFVLIGGSDDARSRWDRALGVAERSIHSAHALVVQLAQAPIGAPANITELRELLAQENPNAARLLERRLAGGGSPVFVCFRVGDERTTYAGLRLIALRDLKPLNYVHGAKAQHAQREQRRIVGWRVDTVSVERADAAWVHGRGFDEEAAVLRSKHVVVVGAGSLGGLVAQALAHAGVGQLTIVDPEDLVPANLGRHVLSARHLQRPKATALAEDIGAQLPHARVNGARKRYQSFDLLQSEATPDLVVSTTADWPTDKHLMDQHAAGSLPAIQLAWAEPHAVAGHSLLAADKSDRPIWLFDDAGGFTRAATRWTRAKFVLPGCAGYHQPSTFNRLQKISAMAVEQAVQYLTGLRAQSEHVTWFGDELVLTRLGGSWTDPSPRAGKPRECVEVCTLPTEIVPA
ncbi:E2/UBC family protein B [Tahibacter aquaticus]|uniref:E2/UBC family protein B n=1 Tax=Tahibacter aquaticus TaxID=520092 RepID=A0A4R6YH98_9GAMM|nr:E2/UBC family protein B [Tahibacter aquaticus]